MAAPRRILVVRLATLGDLLMATPALRALRTSFPQAHIGVLATPGSVGALRGLDSVDEVLSFDKHAFDRPVDALGRLATATALSRQLRRGNWDTLVLLHHLTTAFGVAKYAALCLASGAPVRVGLDNGRGWFLTHAAQDRGFGWRHEVDYSLDVVEVLGAARPVAPGLELVIGPEDEAWAAACWADLGLAPNEDVVLLGPGSGAFSVARRWMPSHFVEVARALQARQALRPLVVAGVLADEHALARGVASELGPEARVVPPAPTPQALAALLRRGRLLVANDSGPVHLATTVGTPVVAVFGPSNDRAWGPYPPDDARHQVVREQLACSPCIWRGHRFGTPQGCPARTCLAILEPLAVVAAAERALSIAPSALGDTPHPPAPMGLRPLDPGRAHDIALT
jgi:ADP-heptose:LPS heptosyltransferase